MFRRAVRARRSDTPDAVGGRNPAAASPPGCGDVGRVGRHGAGSSERTERVGPKELLVFDAATGRPLRRLGDPLPKDRFQWATPIAVEPDGSSVVMQVYTVSGPPGVPGAGAAPAPDASAEYTFHTTRWDPVKKASLREWLVTGHRTDAVRRYAPYAVSLGVAEGDYSNKEKKLQPAKVRCYSLADGTLAHEALLTALAARKLSPAEVRELRAVQALEWQGTPAAREVLAEWARGDPAAALTRPARGAGR